jgi:catechol-2,3-dioxygenase
VTNHPAKEITMAEAQKTGPERPSSGVVVQHLVLRVRDLEKSHDFYTRILGFEQCGELDPARYQWAMRFYRGSADHHHDLALAQLDNPDEAPTPEPWQMFGRTPGIDHVAMRYPGRESWLSQIEWMKSQSVEFLVRGNHGMTHSAYVQDPDGNGIEVLYDVPSDMWSGDVNEALNHFDPLPLDSLDDTTDYVQFAAAEK